MIINVVGMSGSRSGYPLVHVRRYIESLPLRTVMIVTGGAVGVDSYARSTAIDRGYGIWNYSLFLGTRQEGWL